MATISRQFIANLIPLYRKKVYLYFFLLVCFCKGKDCSELCIIFLFSNFTGRNVNTLAETSPSMLMKVLHLFGYHFWWSLRMEMET